MKRIIIILVLVLTVLRTPAKADEGMWLPFLIDDALYGTMQEMGLNLTRDQLFSFTESSLKDAIVHFGGGCTAEIISDQGLVLTNHHCGYGRIQAHSSVGNDLLKDGYWASSLEEELPNENLFVRFLVQARDVTDEISALLNDSMSEPERDRIIRSKGDEIVREATEGTHYTANVRPLFAGNEFFLFVFETFPDVRLVGTPPESIGSYGGDTDNWMWPRHTGDFSLFRVYTGPDGKPAPYSPDNIPLRPRHHLPISIKGVEEGDFAMILGYPGRTNRYLTSHGIEFNLEDMYQVRIDIRREKLDIIEAAMASSDELRIKYASKQSGIANYWKNFIGMSQSLKRLKVADSKRELEDAFEGWVAQDPARQAQYGQVLEMYREAYAGYRQFNSQNYVFSEAMASGPDMLRLANSFDRLLGMMKEKADEEELAEEIRRLRNMTERTFRNYDQGVDEQLWAAMFRTYYERIPGANLPDIFLEIERRYRNDFDRYAADVYKKSVFSGMESLNSFFDKPSVRTLERDPAFRAARSVYSNMDEISPRIQAYDVMVSRAERLFIRGLREMMPERSFYPDANSTMRFTYGSVGGYPPADAVYYDFKTTLSGVMEKEDPGHHEFIVEPELKALYRDKDYGSYGTDGQMVVNFISNNDITGGNSGSPVINGDGHLIGLAFDGNWEAMSGDILFESQVQRSINVDARYILFLIDKFAGSSRIIDELTIIR
jgi:hypothetical protein